MKPTPTEAEVQRVLSGELRWACVRSDAVEFLRSLPDDSIDLLFTSPPYLSARTYGRDDVARGVEDWVAWMVQVVAVAAQKVKGLIAVNCEGQTRNYRYQPSPFLLMADLHRSGFNLRKPCVYERDGIPGSGGHDWLKNRWEPIVCVTRPGRLPWSDNTACGHRPKFKPGGEMSYRDRGGVRKTRAVTRRSANGCRSNGVYVEPELANPGNVIDCGADTHFGYGNESEAPFPIKLAEVFIRSFCPPGGVVCDPFSGSGTVCYSAVDNGRRFVGCDLRESQVELCGRRMAGVTPPLFVSGAVE